MQLPLGWGGQQPAPPCPRSHKKRGGTLARFPSPASWGKGQGMGGKSCSKQQLCNQISPLEAMFPPETMALDRAYWLEPSVEQDTPILLLGFQGQQGSLGAGFLRHPDQQE